MSYLKNFTPAEPRPDLASLPRDVRRVVFSFFQHSAKRAALSLRLVSRGYLALAREIPVRQIFADRPDLTKFVAVFPSVEKITFMNSISLAEVATLQKLSNLTSLKLHTLVSNDVLTELVDRAPPRLRRLAFLFTPPSAVRQLVALSTLRTLAINTVSRLAEQLMFQAAAETFEEEALVWNALPLFTQLAKLKLRYTTIGKTSPDEIIRLSALHSVWDLHFEGCQAITNAAIEPLFLTPFANKLERLNLSGCAGLTADCLEVLSRLTNLRFLGLPKNSFVNDVSLRVLEPLTRLQTLDLNFCQNVQLSGAAGPMLSQFPRLTQLRLESCEIVNESMEWIGRCQQLKTLSLRHCTFVTDAGIGKLSGLQHLSSLSIAFERLGPSSRRYQYLSNDPADFVTDASIGTLCRFMNSSLQHLDVSHRTRLTDNTITMFAEMRALRTLILSGCTGITESGLIKISQLTQLKTLSIAGTRATDTVLCAFTTLNGLFSLSLDRCFQITDRGALQLLKLSELRQVHLLDTKASWKTVKALRSQNITVLSLIKNDERKRKDKKKSKEKKDKKDKKKTILSFLKAH